MPSDDREMIQRFIDGLFAERKRVSRLDVIIRAEALDLDPDLNEVFELLPPGTYIRRRLCNQINAAIVGHGWSRRYGTVE